MSQNPNESPIKLTEIEGRGRGLIASQPLKAGQVILRDSPILLYSALPLPHTYCLNCFRTLPPLPSLCPTNPSHKFCSHNCLTNSLNNHSAWVCNKLTDLTNANYPAITRHQSETLIQLYYLVAAYNLSVASPDKFRLLLSLDGGIKDVDIGEARLLCGVIGVEGFTVEMTGELLGKDKVNAFGLMERVGEGGGREVRAYGIYSRASFFNHDCLPNACRFDYVDESGMGNTDIVVRMIHEVPEGREICLSYFPVDEGYASRQKRLKEDYGFVCECDRCKVEANWSDEEDQGEVDDEGMDDDQDDGMVGSEEDESGGGDGESDFPHAYFFVRYMCNKEDCGGTMAPLPPLEDGTVSNIMECNACGNLKNADEDEGESSHFMDE